MIKIFISLIMAFSFTFSAGITKEELPGHIADMYLFFQLDENDARYKEYFSDIMEGVNDVNFYNSVYTKYFPAGRGMTYELSYKKNKDFALLQKKYFDEEVDKYLKKKHHESSIPEAAYDVVGFIVGWVVLLGIALYGILELIFKFKIFRFVIRKL